MTDKQIIFDDVDVKDCIAYAKSQTIYLGYTVYKQMEKVCMVKNQPCKFFDCQFKQMARELKAKEKECKELKETIQLQNKMQMEVCEEKNTELDQLKAENDELKFQNKRLDEVALYWHKRIFKVERNERKLKQTLTEIKEIAKNGCYDDCGMPLDELSIILQKISEVEEC
jgi:hypothetical protein